MVVELKSGDASEFKLLKFVGGVAVVDVAAATVDGG